MKEKKGHIDWILLFFLLLLTNQAVFSVKLVGIAFILLVRNNWDFGFNKDRLPKFYLYIIALSAFTFLFVTREYTKAYFAAFAVGNVLWLFSLIASHQIKRSVEHYGFEGAYKTLKAFTVIHFVTCLIQLVKIMMITGRLNPYDSTLHFPYGMSTGDNIYGIFLQNSYYSIMVSSMLAIFFLFQRNWLFTALAITCMVLVFGNFGTIIFVSVLFALFMLGIFFSGLKEPVWIRKSILPGYSYWAIPFIFIFIAILYINLSPSNYDYVVDKVKAKVFRIKKEDKNNFATQIENQRINSEMYDPFADRPAFEITPAESNNMGTIAPDFRSTNDAKRELTTNYIRNLQGKNLSVFETMAFLKSSPKAFLFGAGTARFSSSTAHKMSDLDSSRLFLALPKYKSELFEQNHYQLISLRETLGDDALKSTANWPDSLYNQLLGEYGVIGAILFAVFYIGYFLKQYKKLTYGIWLILLLLPFAHLNYTFDTLCVIQFFEFLMFADLYRGEQISIKNE